LIALASWEALLTGRTKTDLTVASAFASELVLSPKWGIAIDGLDASQRQLILDRMSSISYDPQDVVFEQGEPSDTLLLVMQGRVRLFQTLDNGDEFTFGITLPGTILGLAAVIADQPRILSAEALDTVTVSAMKRKDLINLMSTLSMFHWNITRLLAILSIESIERSGPMALDSASVRLGNALQSLARPDPGNGDTLVVEGITQQELAKMVGASRSWITIALADFEKQGLIRKRRERIEICDARRLASFITRQRNH
jgi:CRP-like cAMP-binding protein